MSRPSLKPTGLGQALRPAERESTRCGPRLVEAGPNVGQWSRRNDEAVLVSTPAKSLPWCGARPSTARARPLCGFR